MDISFHRLSAMLSNFQLLTRSWQLQMFFPPLSSIKIMSNQQCETLISITSKNYLKLSPLSNKGKLLLEYLYKLK